MICDFVRPDSVPAVQAYMTTDVCGDYRFSPGVTDCTSWDRQTDLYSLGEMLLSRVDFSDAGRTCCMDFSTRWMCFQAWITDSRLWMLVQTLPLPREELPSVVGFPGASPEGVARLHGKVHRHRRVFGGEEDWGYITPAAVDGPPFCVRPVTGSHLFSPPLGSILGGCAESSPGAGESAGTEDWSYIRPAAVDEPPFCVQPVTGTHLFSPPL